MLHLEGAEVRSSPGKEEEVKDGSGVLAMRRIIVSFQF